MNLSVFVKPTPQMLFPFTVAGWVEGDDDWTLFRCQAEDAAHADEQFRNAYPGAEVAAVQPGGDDWAAECARRSAMAAAAQEFAS